MDSISETQAEKEFRLPRWLEWLLGVVVVLELIVPFVTTTYGVDGGLHLNWIRQFSDLIVSGILIPRWAPTGFYGFGAATFYFYPPLTYYIASIIRIISGINTVTTLYQMTGLVATVASFFSMRSLLSRLGSQPYQRNLGSLLYAFAPFRMAELYSRSSLSTHVAYVILPFVAIAVVQVYGQKWKFIPSVLKLGVAMALLFLTNVPLTCVTLIAMAIGGLVFWKNLNIRIVREFAWAGVVALGISFYQVAAILSARPYVQLHDLRPVKLEFLLTDLWHGTSLPAGYHVGLLYFAVGILCVAYWKYRRETFSTAEHQILKIGLGLVFLTLFLELPVVSLPVWESIPPFPLIQFGWRFYAFFILLIAIIVGISETPGMRKASVSITGVWTIGALAPALLLVFQLHAFSHYTRPIEDATEYRPNTTVSRNDLISIFQPLEKDSTSLTVRNAVDRISNISRAPDAERYAVVLSEPAVVTFHRFYWPFWHLYARGTEISSHPDSIGRATAMVPFGNYFVEWKLERTPLERAGLWISGITIVFVISAGLIQFRLNKGK